MAAARVELHALRERCMRAEHGALQIANAVLAVARDVDLLPALSAHSHSPIAAVPPSPGPLPCGGRRQRVGSRQC